MQTVTASRYTGTSWQPAQFNQPQIVQRGELHGDVSEDGGHCIDFELPAEEREQDGLGVVDSGVGIDNDTWGRHAAHSFFVDWIRSRRPTFVPWQFERHPPNSARPAAVHLGNPAPAPNCAGNRTLRENAWSAD